MAGVVPLREPNQGIQFSPFGLTGLDESRPQSTATEALSQEMPAAETAPETTTQDRERAWAALTEMGPRGGPAAFVTAPASPGTPQSVASPKSVVKAAKSRIKELRAFMKQAKRAEKELRELERLVAAAKKPLAPVRDIKRTAG